VAPSRSATSITWSVGTNRNAASLSTNFLISQGQATRSTLTCSRVIHFIACFSFLLHRLFFKRTTTRNDGSWLLHLVFLIHSDTATGQENVEALPPCVICSGMGTCLGGNLLFDRHGPCVDHVDDTRRLIEEAEVRDSNVEAAKLVIVPDRVGWARNRYPRLFSTRGEIERDHRASIAGHKRPAAILIEVQPMRPRAPDGEPLNQHERICREHRYAGRFTYIDQKAISHLVVDSPARATRKFHRSHHLAYLRVDQPRLVLLDIGHQQMLPARVPGQTVGFLSDRSRSQDSIRGGIDPQEFARSACSREDQCVFLGTEHPAGLRAAGDGCQVAQVLPIDNLNSTCCRIGDEDAATLDVYLPVVEVTLRVRWQGNVLA